MKTLLDRRWFAGIELFLTVVCAAVWYFWPQVGAWILPLAFTPWLLRLLGGRFPYRRTALDIPVLVFLVMALVGVWAAYDRTAALSKFWILLAGILLFYALASQPQANWSLVIGFLVLLGAFIAAYFLLAYSWQAQPADLDFLNRIGLGWMKVRPSIQQAQPDHNRIGGILAVLSPFVLAGTWNAWRERRIPALLLAISCGILVFLGLLMSSSRAAWLALGLGIGFCLFIKIGSEGLSKREYIRTRFTKAGWRALFFTSMAVVVLSASVLLFSSNRVTAFLRHLPRSLDAESRIDLYRNSISLIPDFPYSGAGLGAFPGNYSRYAMLIPDYVYGYSQNLFLDLALEQGVLSSLAVIIVILGSLRALFAADSLTVFQWATFIGMLTFSFQGLAGDAFYGNPGTPLLFLLPGLTCMFAGPKSDMPFLHSESNEMKVLASSLTLTIVSKKDPQFSGSNSSGKYGKLLFTGLASLLIGGLTLGCIFRAQLLSAWYTDLGSVQMARVELRNWSPQNNTPQVDLEELATSEALFRQALQLEPQNRAAQFRLGLIALGRRDFNSAINYFEPGYLAGSRRRGLEKALGYSYAWSGQLELGAALLMNIPEAREELGTYSWWWGTQGRQDLAQRALQMADLLAVNSPSQN